MTKFNKVMMWLNLAGIVVILGFIFHEWHSDRVNAYLISLILFTTSFSSFYADFRKDTSKNETPNK